MWEFVHSDKLTDLVSEPDLKKKQKWTDDGGDLKTKVGLEFCPLPLFWLHLFLKSNLHNWAMYDIWKDNLSGYEMFDWNWRSDLLYLIVSS